MTIMKKLSIVLSAAFVLIALASCNKEKDIVKDNTPEAKVEQSGSIPFVLQANLPQTKTTLDPSNYEVSWADGDVIYAVTADGAWGSGETNSAATAASFTYSGSESSFSTSSPIADGSHTFYFVYEPSSQAKFHRSAATTFNLQATQSQNCSDATAHIKQNDVLAGKLTATTPSKLAKVDLAHVNALMQFNITNNTGADATLTGFDITFDGANIAGIETISFTGDPATASITGSGKDKITVNLTNGAVANGETLPIYFVMAPLADYTGDVTINVYNSAGGYYTKTSTISSAKSFVAGTYNRTTVPITSWINPLTFTRINDVNDLTDGDYKYVIVGKKAEDSYGILSYGSLNSGKLNYVKAYDALPASTIEIANPNSMWSIAVSTTEPKTATLYNAANDKYLAANSNLSFVAAGSATHFTVSSESNLFAFAQSSYFLGVNKNDGTDYWRDYAGGTLFASNGKVLSLYRYWEESTLASIALSGTYPTEFHQGDAFSYEGLVVRATYDNGKSRIVTPTSVSTPDMSSVAAGVEVTVSYTEGLVTKTATYTVDITSAVAPKTITKAATTNGSFVTDPADSAVPGATVTITPSPAAGYGVNTITVVCADSTPVEVINNQFTMPDQNVTVTVTFIRTYVLVTDNTYGTGSNNGYANLYDVTCDGIQWKGPGNQTLGAYWQIGGLKKSKAGDADMTGDRFIYGQGSSTIGFNVTTIKIFTNGVDNTKITVNSITVTAHASASDAASGANVVASFTTSDALTFAASTDKTITFTKSGSTDCTSKFYRIAFNLTNTDTKNHGLKVTSISFTE